MKTKTLGAVSKKGLDKTIKEFLDDNPYAKIIGNKFAMGSSFAVLILYED